MVESKSAFVETFGDAPLIRVLDFMLCEGLMFDYSLTEISEHSGVSWSTINRIFPNLVKQDIVKPTRKIGRAQLYQLNKDNPKVKALLELDRKLSQNLGEKVLEEQSQLA